MWKGGGRGITRDKPYSRAEADAIMREAMANRGVDLFRRTVIYLAVRLFGGSGWGQEDQRRRREQADETFAFS